MPFLLFNYDSFVYYFAGSALLKEGKCSRRCLSTTSVHCILFFAAQYAYMESWTIYQLPSKTAHWRMLIDNCQAAVACFVMQPIQILCHIEQASIHQWLKTFTSHKIHNEATEDDICEAGHDMLCQMMMAEDPLRVKDTYWSVCTCNIWWDLIEARFHCQP